MLEPEHRDSKKFALYCKLSERSYQIFGFLDGGNEYENILSGTRAEHGITAFPRDGAEVIFTKSHSVEEVEAYVGRQTSKALTIFFFFVLASIGRSMDRARPFSFLPFFLSFVCLFFHL